VQKSKQINETITADPHDAMKTFGTPRHILESAFVLVISFYGCAAPIQGLWPPQDGAPFHTIVISLDTWHAMIAFPLAPFPSDRTSAFEEWGYAEQAWYLEGRQGVTGAIRALFWPSPGVIEVGLHNQFWAARTPQPPSDVFIFRLSESGYRQLRRHLRSTIGAAEPIVVEGGSRFYPSKQSYHLFHHCHQYAAEALREAGLPVSAWAAFSRTSLAMQLRRAVRLAADEDVAKTIGDFQAAGEPK
jgi:hypothetical protein